VSSADLEERRIGAGVAPVVIGGLVVGRTEQEDVFAGRFLPGYLKLCDVGCVVGRLPDGPRHGDDVDAEADGCAHGLG
jgi:hypothetical protein